MKLVGYCRVSTDNQREEVTIALQHQALIEYAQAHGHELVETFQDNGVSGAKDLENRPGLVGMFDCLESRQDIDGVVIFKLDRLARDLYIQEHLIKKLQDINKTLVSVKEPDILNAEPTKKAFRQLLGIFSELEKSFIAMRLQAGKNRKATRGGFCGSRVPMGYQTTADKELVVDNDAADVIRTIFTLREKGYTLRQISEYLNSNNVPTSRHKVWYARTVKYMLDNPIYQGVATYKTVSFPRQDLALI